MTNISIKLRKPIPKSVRKILRTVSNVCLEQNVDSFVIGAAARDYIFEYVYDARITRATQDIDFGIAVKDWKEYEKLKIALLATDAFEASQKNLQSIVWKSAAENYSVDLVPYGAVESPKGTVEIASGEFLMSTIGFEIVRNDALILEVEDDLNVNVASLRGLAILKSVAFKDRPIVRRKDLKDIWFIARNYLEAGNEDRLYDSDSDLLDDDFDMRTVGARLLGRDVGELIEDELARIVLKPISENAIGGKIEEFADLIIQDRLRDAVERELILQTLREFRKGIEERLMVGV